MNVKKNTPKNQRMQYLPNLTGLRFFLASLVMLFHIPQFCENRGFPFYKNLPIFHRGTEAVYAFFTLSGFLIIRKLYLEKTNGKISLVKFYKNRILRIFPLYYLVLITGFIYYKLILPKFGFPPSSDYPMVKGILLGATFFSNILATYSPGGILEILWSLAIEEQFYLIIAPIIGLIPSKKIKTYFFIFSLVYLGLFSLNTWIPLQKWKMYYFYFSFAGFTSVWVLKNNFVFKNLWFKTIIYLLVGMYFFTSFWQTLLPNYMHHIFTMILFSMFIACLSVQKNNLFENKTIKHLGKISYGIYMYHPIVFQLVGFVFYKIISPTIFTHSVFILIFNGLIFFITITIAHFSYKYYESYFLNKKTTMSTA